MPELHLQQEALKIVSEGKEREITVRLVGGLAVACRCPVASNLPSLRREYQDIDFVAHRRESRQLRALMEELGYVGDRRFNAVNGDRRLLYANPETELLVDVFLDIFIMCHEFDFTDRLAIDEETLTLADLLLTKLQVVEATVKDLGDTFTLLLEYPLTDDDRGINLQYIVAICANDWGLQTLVSDRLVELRTRVFQFQLDQEQVSKILGRISEMEVALSNSTKSRRWKLRAAIGRHKKWYEIPEEKARDT